MSDCIVKIERLANGYEVEMRDPAIVKKNSNMKSGGYKDPHVSYAFKTVDEVMAFLKKNLDKAMPMDEYESSFAEAVTEEDGDD